MKVIVIGATGSVGALTVQQLLEEGHEVTAFARAPLQQQASRQPTSNDWLPSK